MNVNCLNSFSFVKCVGSYCVVVGGFGWCLKGGALFHLSWRSRAGSVGPPGPADERSINGNWNRARRSKLFFRTTEYSGQCSRGLDTSLLSTPVHHPFWHLWEFSGQSSLKSHPRPLKLTSFVKRGEDTPLRKRSGLAKNESALRLRRKDRPPPFSAIRVA